MFVCVVCQTSKSDHSIAEWSSKEHVHLFYVHITLLYDVFIVFSLIGHTTLWYTILQCHTIYV